MPAVRRINRWLLNALTVLSLLLCVATLGLWLRSYRGGDRFPWRRSTAEAPASTRVRLGRLATERPGLVAVRGVSCVYFMQSSGDAAAAAMLDRQQGTTFDDSDFDFRSLDVQTPQPLARLGFIVASEGDVTPRPAYSVTFTGRSFFVRAVSTSVWVVAVPCWSLLAISLPLPLARGLRALRARRLVRLRSASGACVQCGYALTGNLSGVCPECGTKLPRTKGDSTTGAPPC